MDLLIFSGQSNMQDRQKLFLVMKKAVEYRLLTDELVELKNPVGEDRGCY